MPERYKLGKHPATRPTEISEFATYVKGKLPPPPASVDAPKAAYPMDGNDTYGDCTIAGVAHLIAAWNVEVSESDPVPDQTSVIQTYFTLTGDPTPTQPSSYTSQYDTGLNEADVLAHWEQDGLFSAKIAGYAPVNVKNIVDLHQVIAAYGGIYLGIQCPESAQDQFRNNQPWTYVPGSPVEGGHAIVGIGYSQTALYCATWGGIAEVTYGFVAHFLEEAWAVIPNQFVEAGKGPEVDLAALKADLNTFSGRRKELWKG